MEIREYTVQELQRYWPQGHEPILKLSLPVIDYSSRTETYPPELQPISLPEWAVDIGVDGQILVPRFLVSPCVLPAWQRTNWLNVVFWYLNGVAERAQEAERGPIHSYSWKLKGWDPRLWERAWVNRIALFLRRWAAQRMNKDETTLFGPLPEPEVVITHDVDAVYKTLAIRFKQTAFYGFNALRSLMKRNLRDFVRKGMAATNFFFSKDDYDRLQNMVNIEDELDLRSHINVYGGPGGSRRSISQMVFDPAYSIRDEKFGAQLRSLSERGWIVGLHQSFHAWKDVEITRSELSQLEKVMGHPITSCRQHWLRFSWQRTWKVQDEAGLKLDTTLGFNDRPGFRNGAALCFHPYDEDTCKPMRLQALPLVLMDSHLYDYREFDSEGRSQEINRWVEEIRAVKGAASFLWHPHTLCKDYDWGEGYRQLLHQASRRNSSKSATDVQR